jgi:glycosyltransferase involved in cell wall biosynthesis
MLDSVFNQTFRDFEIVIVNDGSTDDSKQILDAVRNERIRIIHTGHLGPSRARNTAVKNSRADIIFNLDADDKIANDLLEKGYQAMMTNRNAGIVYSDCSYFGARTGIMKAGKYSLKGMLEENKIISAAFFRKTDWEKTGGYSECFSYGLEDWDFWLSIIELGREVIKVEESMVYYRKYKSMSESRSGRRKADREKSENALSEIFARHKKLYSLYPALYSRFSKIEAGRKKEGPLELWWKNKFFGFKQKYHYLIR